METPRKFINAIINLRGVSTKLNKYIVFTMQTYKKLSTNLARLANHLDQVHGMDTEERKKWLKWSKIGICVPPQDVEPRELNMEKSVETLLKRQEEMERKFNVYLQAAKLKKVQSSKRKNSNLFNWYAGL